MVGRKMMGERMGMVPSHLPNTETWPVLPRQGQQLGTGVAEEPWWQRHWVIQGGRGWRLLCLSLWALLAAQPSLAMELGHRCLTHQGINILQFLIQGAMADGCLGCLLRAVFHGTLSKRRWDGVVAELGYL